MHFQYQIFHGRDARVQGADLGGYALLATNVTVETFEVFEVPIHACVRSLPKGSPEVHRYGDIQVSIIAFRASVAAESY